MGETLALLVSSEVYYPSIILPQAGISSSLLSNVIIDMVRVPHVAAMITVPDISKMLDYRLGVSMTTCLCIA